MNKAIASLTLLLASCVAGPQVGVRNARGFEGGTGSQLGAGVRGQVGPIELSAMRWGGKASGEETFVNRSSSEIDSEALQVSAGMSHDVMVGENWTMSLGAGVAWQRSNVQVQLDYTPDAYDDMAEEWTAYGEARLQRGGFHVALRVDEPLHHGQDALTTTPGGRGLSLLSGISWGF